MKIEGQKINMRGTYRRSFRSHKKISIEEFQKQGYLQELNRIFLHPLGLALSVIVEEDGVVSGWGPIYDFRDDPAGIDQGGVRW